MDAPPGYTLSAEEEVAKATIYEIGALIVCASLADFAVGICLTRMVSGQRGPPNLRVSALVSGMDLKVKLAIIRMLASSFPKEAHTRAARKICDRLQAVFQNRNVVAHMVPQMDERGRTQFFPTKRDAKTGEALPPKPLTPEQIRRWAYELDQLTAMLDGLLDSYGFPGPPEIAS